MKFKITAQNGVTSVKWWMRLIMCWPPPLNATRKQLILHNVGWCVVLFIPLHLIPASLLGLVRGPHDVTSLTKHFAECLTVVVTSIKMIISKCQQSRLQVALTDLEEFVKNANSREQEMLDRYIERCGTFYAVVQFSCLMTSTLFVFSPIILPQPLPANVDYPFAWKDSPTRIAILYGIQVVAAYQVSAGAILDIQIGLLLFFAAIRFEILAEDFENASNTDELRACIEKHQELIISTTDMTIAVQYFIVDVIINTCITNVCTGYQFVSHQPIEAVLQFFFLFCITSLEVAMYAWPSDNLLAVTEKIALCAYSSPWVDQCREMREGVQIVIMRAQKPIIISIDGMLPEMNLEFYGKFLTTSFSYFTTLRAVFG